MFFLLFRIWLRSLITSWNLDIQTRCSLNIEIEIKTEMFISYKTLVKPQERTVSTIVL